MTETLAAGTQLAHRRTTVLKFLLIAFLLLKVHLLGMVVTVLACW